MISIKYTENSYKLPILIGIYVGQTEICTLKFRMKINKQIKKQTKKIQY